MRFAASLSTVSFCSLAFLLVAGSAVAPAAADDALDALLAKSRAASGAPYRFHVVSRSRETDDGHEYTVTTETEGLKYRARKCTHGLCTSGFYFDGERSFDTNFNDTALPLSERVDGLQLTLRAIASYDFTAPDFRANGGSVQSREPILRDGKKFLRISVAPRLGALLDAVIDPDSGLVIGVISDARRLAFEFRDQRKVGDRITLPYEIELNGATIEKFDDRSIEAAPLAAPAGISPHFSSGPVTVDMTRNDAPLVPCTVGGENVACLLDTGNSGLSISSELATKLGLTVQTGGGTVGGTGGAIVGVVKAPALGVGGATYPSARYVVLYNLHTSGYDVVLGADAFANARVTLDFQTRTVTIASATGAASPAANSLPLEFENFVPTIPIGFGSFTTQLAVDTGDASAVELAADFAALHPSAIGTDVTGKVGNVAVSGLRVTSTKRLQATDRGVIGSGLLQHFVATFDYARGRLGLVPAVHDAQVKPE
jgi:hypothetical protein